MVCHDALRLDFESLAPGVCWIDGECERAVVWTSTMSCVGHAQTSFFCPPFASLVLAPFGQVPGISPANNPAIEHYPAQKS